MSSGKKKRTWPGGYIRDGKRGPAYIIERWRDGRRYHVSTKCRTRDGAMEQLKAFEADPPNYRPGRLAAAAAPPSAARMTSELVLEYGAWMAKRPRPASREHIAKHLSRLSDWKRFLAGRDLRDVKLRDLHQHLATRRDRGMRIQAIRSFCAWMRRERFLLERNEDPTVDLLQPPRAATKDTRRVAIEPARFRAVLPHLPETTQDVLVLRLGTGWHTSEVRRFATEGNIRRTPGKTIFLASPTGPVEVPLLAVLEVRQKIGVTTKTPILHVEHLEAAERIQARRYVQPNVTLANHVTKACAAAGVERFLLWHVRHAVVSNALEEGADMKDASVFVDHLHVDTTRRHYAQLDLPRKAVPVLQLLAGGKT